jgi:hypothetical protein
VFSPFWFFEQRLLLLSGVLPACLKASTVPDRGKVRLSIDFVRARKNRTGANLPGAFHARQQLPLPVKFAGMR